MEWKEKKLNVKFIGADYGPSSSLATKLLSDLAKSRSLDLEMADSNT